MEEREAEVRPEPKIGVCLLTVSDVAKLLGCSVATVHNTRNRDRTFPVPVRGPFRGTRWRSTEVEEWIKGLPHLGDPPLPSQAVREDARPSGPMERLSRREARQEASVQRHREALARSSQKRERKD